MTLAAARWASVSFAVALAGVLIAFKSIPPAWHGAGIVALCVLSVVWVAGAIRRDRPFGGVWPLVFAAVALNALWTVVWWSPVLAGGDMPLGVPSVADGGWIVADQLLAAALVVSMCKRETPLLVALDVLTIAVGVGLVVGVSLVGPDFATSIVPMKVRVTQACYVVSDVIVISAAARLLLAPRPRPPAAWLLAGGALAVAFSDVAWNWLTISGTYMPGSWGEIGWILQPVLLGMAALHPSMRRLGMREQRRDIHLQIAGPLLLGAAALVSPILLGLHHFVHALPDVDSSTAATLAVAIGGAALAALAVTRFMVLLRQARSLAERLGDALDERGRMLERSSKMLERSQLRYKRLVEKFPGVVHALALGDGSTPPAPAYVSPSVKDVLGVSVEDWMRDGMRIFRTHIHPDDRERMATFLPEVISGGDPQPFEFRWVRDDGRVVWLREAGAVVTGHGSERVLQGMFLDVTEAKRAESERDRMELDLRLAQKLEAVGQLAAGIAHEINTPTQFVGDTVHFLDGAFGDVMGLLESYELLLAAAEAGSVPEELVAAVREAQEAADLEYLRERVPAAFERAGDGVNRVATIVRAMREFAHPPTADTAPVDINGALSTTLGVATHEYKYVADVETDFADLPLVTCDGGGMNQVFLNLIVNAAHAIGDATRDGERGLIRVATAVDGDHVRISIADTGGGIPPEVADRIYDPFFTTKDVGRGTGQGLAIARTIVVERHGGTLSFDTEPGHGTTFHIRLPIAAQASMPTDDRMAA